MHFPFTSITWKYRDLLVLIFIYKAVGSVTMLHREGWGNQGKADARSYKGRERGSFTSAKSMLFPFIVKNVAVTRV